MTIKCIECKLHWNVSVKKTIHPKGYICPWCIAKRSNPNNKDKQQRQEKGK
ncbi:hypothetical protein [Clostridium sp. C2-6-12]|uniref:hypothetical protein n=1 Tax=Clostridium sp. C2-6-12 TaxID=2698832 RepID=UPI00136E16FD|nr:hypothetical protein [Clostridium sp. C2-6-12]